jgi:hypothetical protein
MNVGGTILLLCLAANPAAKISAGPPIQWSASQNSTAAAVDLIPKDIIICDWHYEKRADYPSVRYFQDKGFRVWPAGWNNVSATKALIACTRHNATDRMLGHLCTTWVLEPGGFASGNAGPKRSRSSYPARNTIGRRMPGGDGRTCPSCGQVT